MSFLLKNAMTKQSIENSPIFAQKVDFTDTGSAKIENQDQKSEETSQFGEKSTEITQNCNKKPENIEFSSEKPANQANFQENQAHLQENPPNPCEFTENPQSSQVQADVPTVSRNVTQNQEITPKSRENANETPDMRHDFFDFANVSAFKKDFPEIDVKKLQDSREFQAFLGILSQKPTLSQIYTCFSEICTSAEEKSEKRLLQALANANAGVGALSSSQRSENPYFTREQVLKMSPQQVRKHYESIRKSQEKW